MPRKARITSNSGLYHIVARGNGKQILFEDDEDYERFLDTLKRYRDEEHFEIIAYCLMDNHFHLLLHADKGLDRIMKKISGSYAFYFNEKYARSGHLFQDRYSSEPIDDDRYLLAVVRYIHNNPLKAGIASREEYPWSSWHEYTGHTDLVSTALILSITDGMSGFLEFSAGNEDVECLDISDRNRLSDKDAKELIRNALQIDSGIQIHGMPREQRNAALHLLRERGLSIRQIERLTGVNRGVILKCQDVSREPSL